MDSAFTDAWQQLTSDGSPFSWSVQDIRGIPTRTYDHAPPHMRFIWELSAGYGDRPYLQFGDETLTYTQAHDVVSSLATYLIEQGVEHGDRVAIAMRNYPEWVLSYWAIISIGAAAVGMNAWWTGPEMEYGLGDSAPKVVIADDKRLATIAPHLDDLRAANPFHLVVVRTDHDLPEDAVTWTEAVTTTNSGLPPAAIDPEDDCAIFYTSGTTGFPKGAALTHRGCVSNIMNFSFWNAVTTAARPQADSLIESHEAATETTALLAVPLFHVTGCNCCMHLITGVGGKIILLHRWDPSEALEIIERERVTAFTGVPVMSRAGRASRIRRSRHQQPRDLGRWRRRGPARSGRQDREVPHQGTAIDGVRPHRGLRRDLDQLLRLVRREAHDGGPTDAHHRGEGGR